MPTVEAGTETREIEFVGPVGGGLKNTRFWYKVKGENGYWGGGATHGIHWKD